MYHFEHSKNKTNSKCVSIACLLACLLDQSILILYYIICLFRFRCEMKAKRKQYI